MRLTHWAGAIVLLGFMPQAKAAPRVERLGDNLYAYVSDNDHSSNSTFLVGQHSILVVDTGLNQEEGEKLLAEIRKISPLPIQFIINTHYHPDHQGGNGIVGPSATVISSAFTRERTLRLMQQLREQASKAGSAQPRISFRPATETLTDKLTVYLDEDAVEIVAAGPAHTLGDVYVYFPRQKTVAAGDLFMSNSCPAMDQGSAANWIRTLDTIAALRVEHFVPGHFDVGSRDSFTRFRDYLADLDKQVESLYKAGANIEKIRQQIDMRKYEGFRQFPQFHATFGDNAETIYRQLESQR